MKNYTFSRLNLNISYRRIYIFFLFHQQIERTKPIIKNFNVAKLPQKNVTHPQCLKTRLYYKIKQKHKLHPKTE